MRICCDISLICKSIWSDSKTWHCWSWRLIKLFYIWNLEIRSWTRSSIFDVLILIIRFIINHCRWWIFLGINTTFHLARSSTFIIFNNLLTCSSGLLLVDDGSFSMISASHSFTCKISRGFIVVKSLDCFDIISTRPKIIICFIFLYSFLFSLRPTWNSSWSFFHGNIIMSWTNFILFFTFINLNWWFI